MDPTNVRQQSRNSSDLTIERLVVHTNTVSKISLCLLYKNYTKSKWNVLARSDDTHLLQIKAIVVQPLLLHRWVFLGSRRHNRSPRLQLQGVLVTVQAPQIRHAGSISILKW